MEITNKLILNKKRTFYIGFAFFSILMLWQMYNHYCPLFLDYLLRKTTGSSDEFLIGLIMAGDNLLAIFMLPLFGNLSDKTKSRFGKRMPYIVTGMILSAILFPLIAVMFYIESLVGTIIMMGVILIVMNMYRNPAVALMPDVTPKPLRPKANGIINFVGYLGAILAGALAMFLKVASSTASNNWIPSTSGKINAIIAFSIASCFMILALVILVLKIKENKILEEVKDQLAIGEKLSETIEAIDDDKPLSKADKRNFIILLTGLLLWYMSFNAIETFNSLFCKNVLLDEGIGSTISIILPISSIITFLTTTNWPAKLGRKKTVLIGIASITIAFILIVLYLVINGVYKTDYYQVILAHGNKLPFSVIPIYLLIAVCGFGWALINASSYPMLVEMASIKTIGKITGYYYTVSMLAQTITPMLVGIIMKNSDVSLRLLYIYSTILMGLAFFTMLLFKGKAKQQSDAKQGLDALDI